MLSELTASVLHGIHALINSSRREYAAVAFGLFVALLYFKIFFRKPGSFKEDYDTLGKLPFIDEDYDRVNSCWSELKILVWIGLSIVAGFASYYQLPIWFPEVFK